MPEENSNDGERSSNPRKKAAWAAVAVLIALPVLVLWMLAGPMNVDDNIALTRNDVVRDSSGARIWLGSMTNVTDSVHREIDVTIRFLDSNDQVVGEVSARTDLLEPGTALALRSPLPPQATRIQVYSLQWRTGRKDKAFALGPWAPWLLGQVQIEWP